MKEQLENKLDHLLYLICNDESGEAVNVVDLVKLKKIDSNLIEILVLAQKLVEEGFIELAPLVKTVKNNDGIETRVPLPDRDLYYKTLNGVLFAAEGGYKNKRKEAQRKRCWIITSTIAHVLNSALILMIAGIGLYLEFFNSEDESRMDSIEERLLKVEYGQLTSTELNKLDTLE
jgi:hypothetical protein